MKILLPPHLQQGVRFDPDMPQTIRLEFAKSNTKGKTLRLRLAHDDALINPPTLTCLRTTMITATHKTTRSAPSRQAQSMNSNVICKEMLTFQSVLLLRSLTFSDFTEILVSDTKGKWCLWLQLEGCGWRWGSFNIQHHSTFEPSLCFCVCSLESRNEEWKCTHNQIREHWISTKEEKTSPTHSSQCHSSLAERMPVKDSLCVFDKRKWSLPNDQERLNVNCRMKNWCGGEVPSIFSFSTCLKSHLKAQRSTPAMVEHWKN